MFDRLRSPSVIGMSLIASFLLVSSTACSAAVSQEARIATTSLRAAKLANQDVYVNCQTGRDGSAGTITAPVRTITNATAAARAPGTTVFLARDCIWNGLTVLRGAGTSTAPVVMTAYGSGAAPVITGRTLTMNQAILQLNDAYQLVKNISIKQAIGPGIIVQGANGRVDGVEISDVGTGVRFVGRAGIAQGVNVHDLHMIQNTSGGDDDFGALGFDVQNTDVEIAGSRCSNCRAISRDYGWDGGFVEVWNYGDRLKVHDNIGFNTSGVLELGGNATNASAVGVIITGNTFNDAHGGVYFHENGKFTMPIGTVNFTNNTITTQRLDAPILGGAANRVNFSGNTVQTQSNVSQTGAPQLHTCNRFVVPSSNLIGYTLNNTERAGGAEVLTQPRPSGCS